MSGRCRRAATLAVWLVFTAGMTHAQSPVPITDRTLSAFQSWIEAVKTHAPGRADAIVQAVAAYSYETRWELNAGMNLFVSALLARPYDTEGNDAARAIAALGHASDKDFLKRAAVLHADAAAYAEHIPPAPARPRPAESTVEELRVGGGLSMPTRIVHTGWVPPLLREERLLLDQDGQVVGETVGTWNWPFARYLLGLLSAPRNRSLGGMDRPSRATDPFVAQWYHATAAYMFASGLYGDATSHLSDGAAALPADAGMLFDRGCYAESLGLPMHQALRPDDRAGRPPSESEQRVRIASADKTNGDAERLYRQALAADPSLTEVRVRLARLLSLRKRDDEAATELKTALDAKPTGAVAFYAHLFAGRTAQARQRADEAATHYREALVLYPDAQSALLASSQLALLAADLPGTGAPIARLGPRSAEFTSDPWWAYHLCAGRDADQLLRAVWASTPR